MDSGGGLESMKLGVVDSRARKGRRKVGGRVRLCHGCSSAVHLRVRLNMLEKKGKLARDVGI